MKKIFMDTIMENMLTDKINSDSLTMTKSTVKINLEKVENQWRIVIDDKLMNAITGNLLNIANMFNQQ